MNETKTLTNLKIENENGNRVIIINGELMDLKNLISLDIHFERGLCEVKTKRNEMMKF